MYLGSSNKQEIKNILKNSKFSIIQPENKFKFIASKLMKIKLLGYLEINGIWTKGAWKQIYYLLT